MSEKDDKLLKDIQEALLEMMVDIDRVCREHGLKYTLYCGTLLGAIRHNGFIPWDDDADIAMPLKDYEKFREIAEQELADKYVTMDYSNSKEHPWVWIRVYKKGTTYLRRSIADVNMYHGIWVDIYPFLGAMRGKAGYLQNQMLRLARGMQRIPALKLNGYNIEDEKLRKQSKVLGIVPGPLRRIAVKALMGLAMRDPDDYEYVGTVDSAPFEGKYKWEDWQEFTEHEFEGHNFIIPVEYDKLLKRMYWDYMTLPSEDARVSHFDDYGDAIIDPHKSYTEYIDKVLAERIKK